ncbi:MAG: PTS sugar transporter subunit IIA, partial [[Clostridium] symbiosum]
MKITDLLKKESIALDVKVDSKGAAIDYLVDLMDKSGRLNDKEGYKKGILAREALGS